MKVHATVERAGDGSWTAAMMGTDTVVLGVGDTREAALIDLRSGVNLLIETLRGDGKTLADSALEYVTLEIAA